MSRICSDPADGRGPDALVRGVPEEEEDEEEQDENEEEDDGGDGQGDGYSE